MQTASGSSPAAVRQPPSLRLAHGATYAGPRGEHGELTAPAGAQVTFPSGATYVGGMLDGRRHGVGVMTLPVPNGQPPGAPTTYEGEWQLGWRHGAGRLRSRAADYTGGFAADRKHGFGVLRDAEGGVHAGEWADDSRHGAGRMLWAPEPAGAQLQAEVLGCWRRDELCGEAVMSWYAAATGALLARYVGDTAGGARDGFGVFHYAGGASFAGMWRRNVKVGVGVHVGEDGRIRAGLWRDDVLLAPLPTAAPRRPGHALSAAQPPPAPVLNSAAAVVVPVHDLVAAAAVPPDAGGPLRALESDAPSDDAATAVQRVLLRWHSRLHALHQQAVLASAAPPVCSLLGSGSGIGGGGGGGGSGGGGAALDSPAAVARLLGQQRSELQAPCRAPIDRADGGAAVASHNAAGAPHGASATGDHAGTLGELTLGDVLRLLRSAGDAALGLGEGSVPLTAAEVGELLLHGREEEARAVIAACGALGAWLCSDGSSDSSSSSSMTQSPHASSLGLAAAPGPAAATSPDTAAQLRGALARMVGSQLQRVHTWRRHAHNPHAPVHLRELLSLLVRLAALQAACGALPTELAGDATVPAATPAPTVGDVGSIVSSGRGRAHATAAAQALSQPTAVHPQQCAAASGARLARSDSVVSTSSARAGLGSCSRMPPAEPAGASGSARATLAVVVDRYLRRLVPRITVPTPRSSPASATSLLAPSGMDPAHRGLLRKAGEDVVCALGALDCNAAAAATRSSLMDVARAPAALQGTGSRVGRLLALARADSAATPPPLSQTLARVASWDDGALAALDEVLALPVAQPPQGPTSATVAAAAAAAAAAAVATHPAAEQPTVVPLELVVCELQARGLLALPLESLDDPRLAAGAPEPPPEAGGALLPSGQPSAARLGLVPASLSSDGPTLQKSGGVVVGSAAGGKPASSGSSSGKKHAPPRAAEDEAAAAGAATAAVAAAVTHAVRAEVLPAYLQASGLLAALRIDCEARLRAAPLLDTCAVAAALAALCGGGAAGASATAAFRAVSVAGVRITMRESGELLDALDAAASAIAARRKEYLLSLEAWLMAREAAVSVSAALADADAFLCSRHGAERMLVAEAKAAAVAAPRLAPAALLQQQRGAGMTQGAPSTTAKVPSAPMRASGPAAASDAPPPLIGTVDLVDLLRRTAQEQLAETCVTQSRRMLARLARVAEVLRD